MKIKHLVVCGLFLISIGCDKSPSAEQTQPLEEISPEILERSDKRSVLDFSSGRSYDENMIDELFEEAIKKNKDLKNLVTRIETLSQKRYDNSKTMSDYLENNRNYYADVAEYLNRIQDTFLRERTRSVFEASEQLFNEKIKEEQQNYNLIYEKSQVLNQQLKLMKLYIADAMMKNYQKDNLPDTKPLKDLIEDYDLLIKETETYIKEN